MTINSFQKWTAELDRKSNWDKISSLQIISHLTEEIGEIARSINRVFEYRGNIRQEHLENLKVELVDSFWFLIKIANRYNINFDAEIEKFVKRASNWPKLKYQNKLINGLNTLNSEITYAKGNLQLKD